jgi:hypothetical protein
LPPTVTSDATGESKFVATFSVAAPTPFALTGNLVCSGDQITSSPVGDTFTASALLTDTSGTLYSLSEKAVVMNSISQSYNAPISYSGTLEPGQSYTLTLDSVTDAQRSDENSLESLTITNGFNFVLAVPEPASFATLMGGAGLLLCKRRRRIA